MKILAVLDTNLVIRAFHTARGVTGRLVKALNDECFELATSEPLLEELRLTFARPAVQRISPGQPLLAADINDNVSAFKLMAASVAPGAYEVDLVSGDPKDNPVVAAALECGADYIVTDDRKHLLPLKAVRVAGYKPVQVVSASAFLRLLDRR